MLASIGVLLVLSGVSLFLIGLLRVIFPSTNRMVPNDFKKVFYWRTGVYLILAGLILLVLIRS